MAASGIRSLRMLHNWTQPVELIINALNPLLNKLILAKRVPKILIVQTFQTKDAVTVNVLL